MVSLAMGAAFAMAGSATGYAAGASIGFSVGVVLSGMLFPEGKKNSEGSRLSDLRVHSSTYGKAIPQVYGAARFAGNVIWSAELQEAKKKKSMGGKGGGGAATSYSYSCSFAVGLCRGPVTAIRRIWADTKLIYDASASSSNAMEKYPGVITIYLGSETQKADPTIQSYLGTEDVPAYRGLAYLVFDNLQLADFGNRIPSIGAEVVAGNDTHVVSADEVELSITSGSSYLDPASGKLFLVNNSTLYKVDAVTMTLESSIELPYVPYVTFGLDTNGNFYYGYVSGALSIRIVKIEADTLTPSVVSSSNTGYSLSGNLRNDLIFINRSRLVYDTSMNLIADLSAVFPFSLFIGECPMCADGSGNYWMVNNGILYRSADGVNVTTLDITAYIGTEKPSAFFYDSTTAHLYIFLSLVGKIIKWSPTLGYVGTLSGVYLIGTYNNLQNTNIYPVKGIIYLADFSVSVLRVQKISLATLEVLETSTVSGTPIYSCSGTCYEKLTNSFVLSTYSPDKFVKIPIQRIGLGSNTLSGTIKSLCLQAGLDESEIDVANVTESLHGYIIANRVSLREAITPLLQGYFIDAVETDGVLRFSSRSATTTPALTIPYDDLGATEGSPSDDGATYITEERAQSFDLPERLDLGHIDPERAYETNTQHAKRPASVETGTDSAEAMSFDIVFTAEEAAQLAERLLFYTWLYRTSYSFNLLPKYLGLDPSDVITVETPLADLTLRLTEVNYGANNMVACKGVLESADAFISTAKGAEGLPMSDEIAVQRPIKVHVLDLPKIAATDDSDFYLYFCFCAEEDSSAMIYYSADRITWSLFGAGSKVPTNGKTPTALGDCLSPWTWDDTNTIRVKLLSGELASATEEEVLNGANAAVLGSEIIQFQNATLVDTDTYELSRLLRGRRGTEAHTSDHLIGDRFVLLEPDSGLYRAAVSQARIGETSYFKGIRAGGNWDDAVEIPLVYNAEAFRCFAPVNISGNRNVSGDIAVSWVRRARWNAEWMSGTDIPLGEATEAYEIDIMNGTEVIRTLTATAPTVTYTAAEQVTDFGSTQAAIAVNIYQMNAIVGRGHAGEAII